MSIRRKNRREFLKSAALAGATTALSTEVIQAIAQVTSSTGESVYRDIHAPLERRVEDLFSRLTQEEKLNLLSGTGFATRPILRLGVPEMRMDDAPQGVRGGVDGTLGPSTLFPASITMASTWNRALIQQLGAGLGRELQNKGVGASVLLGPCVNIHRSPLGGRNMESFSEDPYLAAKMAVAYVRGVQSTGAAACVKHYACNNEETDRGYVNVEVGERALHEIYLPAFKAGVREGGAYAIMGAYNRLNGPFCCANHELMTEIMKRRFGFTGVVMSDWGAVHDTVDTVNAGTDLEMPGGDFLVPDKLRPALKSGKIQQRSIDDSVRRILRTVIRTGLLDHPLTPSHREVNSPENQRVALQTAREGIILLKNERNLLPLDSRSVKTLAVIGPMAAVGQPHGGGSATIDPVLDVTPLDEIKKRAGEQVKVIYAEGTSLKGPQAALVPAAVLSPDERHSRQGLKGEYFNNQTLSGSPLFTRVDPTINFDWGGGSPDPRIHNEHFSIRWTGFITAPRGGQYIFSLASDDGSRFSIDGKQLIDNWSDHASAAKTGEIELQSGTTHTVTVEYYQNTGLASVRLGWVPPGTEKAHPFAEAVSAAKSADVVALFVGVDPRFEGEGQDRETMVLPGDQNALVRAVAEANPRTVLFLTNGTHVDMSEWHSLVPAILENWYAGEFGGRAIAEILFGDVNPSGKLPDTLGRRREDYPDYGHFPGVDGVVRYTEGIFVGYRHFDHAGIEPLYPFGHGLSYTRFQFSNLGAPRTFTRGSRKRISFIVRNTGQLEGAEVTQLYVHAATPLVERPLKELKGFEKVFLRRGEQRRVELEIDDSTFERYDPGRQEWRVDPGEYELLIGASSRDLRLKAWVRVV